jgi:hypothetical protein
MPLERLQELLKGKNHNQMMNLYFLVLRFRKSCTPQSLDVKKNGQKNEYIRTNSA